MQESLSCCKMVSKKLLKKNKVFYEYVLQIECVTNSYRMKEYPEEQNSFHNLLEEDGYLYIFTFPINPFTFRAMGNTFLY